MGVSRPLSPCSLRSYRDVLVAPSYATKADPVAQLFWLSPPKPKPVLEDAPEFETPSAQPPSPRGLTASLPPATEPRKKRSRNRRNKSKRKRYVRTSRRRSYRDHFNLQIVSHNIRGTQGDFDPDNVTRDLGDLEVLTSNMSKQKTDVLLLQETWEPGTWTRIMHGVTVIHHGAEEGARNKGGVAILLGPRATRAWVKAGKPDPHYSGPLAGDNT